MIETMSYCSLPTSTRRRDGRASRFELGQSLLLLILMLYPLTAHTLSLGYVLCGCDY